MYFFRAGSFDIEKFSISYEKSTWYEYFKCGIQGIRDKYPDIKLKGINKKKRKFFDYLKNRKYFFRCESINRWNNST